MVLRHLAIILLVLGAGAASAASPGSGSVSVLEIDPAAYTATSGLSDEARRTVARRFFASNSDSYDFLVVFPAFPTALREEADGAHALGLHTLVRADVAGIGKPSSYDRGATFGSRSRLKGYIDIGTLVPGMPNTLVAEALTTLAHEVAHQWSGETGGSLVGRDGAHWSFFLDSNASVLYGSEWRDNGDGTFTAVASKRRYSPLDLYLMGFLEPQEVPPFTLLSPGPGVPYKATDTPPPPGTTLPATATPLTLEQLRATLGERRPGAAQSQRDFRAAFILLVPPGGTPTPAQLAHVEEVRTSWANAFFFLTRGRAWMETERIARVPEDFSSAPSVNAGLRFLLSRQQADGSWADHPETAIRETEAALSALALFSGAEVHESVARAALQLEGLEPGDSDGRARRLRGLSAALRPDIEGAAALAADTDTLGLWKSGGRGLTPGYGATVLDTVLVGLALSESQVPEFSLGGLTRYLLARQNADGGWPAFGQGPSRVEVTALVLQYLARRERTDALAFAAGAAWIWLGAHQEPDGLFIDDLEMPGTTAQVILALEAWGQLGSWDGSRLSSALLSRQLQDGSWEGSTWQTALVLRALRQLLVPNLRIAPPGVTLPVSTVVEGEVLSVGVPVRNTGFVASGETTVQLFDSDHQPFGAPQRLAPLAPGQQTNVWLRLDTQGRQGLEQFFVVVDPEGLVDETREDDNRAALELRIEPAPAGVELYVAAGSLVATPDSITRVPQPAEVTFLVGNAGQTEARGVTVALAAGGKILQSTTVELPARSSLPVAFTVALPGGPYPLEVRALVDPGNAFAEPREDNNEAVLFLKRSGTVDLSVEAVGLPPGPVEQGEDVLVTVEVHNAGTLDALGASVAVRVVGADGSLLATRQVSNLNVASGATARGSVRWRASVAGTHTVEVQASHPEETWPGNESATGVLTVHPSSRPNLVLAAGALSTSPARLLEGRPATALAQVHNGGAAEVGPFTVDFHLGAPEAGGAHLGTVSVAGLGAGESTTVSVPFTPDFSDTRPLVARADPDGRVVEFDESDNSTLIDVTPLALADLVLADGDIQPSRDAPREGETLTITVFIRNQGRQPSPSARVSLHLEAPESGGALIGTKTLGSLEGPGEAQVEFVWDTAGLTGPRRLVAMVTPDDASEERPSSNNRGERQVLIQSEALALREPYFSPNGDGVKDATGLDYRLPEPGASVVLVTTADGRAVRRLEVPDPGAPFGSVTWDGQDETGRVVEDGEYRLTALAGAHGEQGEIGSALAVVDTNRFPIEKLEDPALLRHVFPTGHLSSWTGRGEFLAMPDDSGFFFYAERSTWPTPRPCGFYFQSFSEDEPQLLTPPTWNCHDYYESPLRYVMAPDGSAIAYLTHQPYSGSWWVPRHALKLFPRAADAPITLLQSGQFRDDLLMNRRIRFSEDSRRIWVIAGDSWESVHGVRKVDGRRFFIVDAQGREAPSRFAPGFTNNLYDFGFSPNQSWMVYQDELNPRCFHIKSLVETTEARSLGCTQGHPEFAWASEGGRLLISRRDGFPQLSPRGGLLSLLDVASAEERTLLEVDAFPSSIQFAPNPRRDALAFAFASGSSPALAEGTIGLLEPIADSTPRLFTRIPEALGVESLEWSPLGTFLHGRVRLRAGQSWTMRDWALRSLANLPAEIRAARAPGSAVISFRGMATDLHFESYTVAVRPFGSHAEPVVIARRRVPVIDGVLATWTPPGPGLYEAVLTVKDKAGNVTTRSTRAVWSDATAIAELSAEPGFISPNGDGLQDEAEVAYRATLPLTTRFSVTDASGHTVRTFDRTHLEPGLYGLIWDGRDETGAPVPDGAYSISAERVGTGLVVDTRSPEARLLPGHQLPRPGEQARLFEFRRATAYDSAGQPVEIPSVGAWMSWEAKDLHFSGGQLEALTSSGTAVLDRSGSASERSMFLGVEHHRGTRLRVRATDQAGNTGLSGELALPERLFLVGIGEAATLESGGMLRHGGRLIPRIDRLRAVKNETRVDATGKPLESFHQLTPSRFVFTPQRYAFALASTLGAPIVSYAVAYPSPVTGAEVIDSENVEMLAEDALLWDARSLPERPFSLKILATDAEGHLFTTVVPFDTRAKVDACVDYTSEEEITVTIGLSRGAPDSEQLAPGSWVEFVPEGGSSPHLSVPLDMARPVFSQDELSYVERIPSAGLTACRYTIAVRGQRRDGSAVEGSTVLDVCGMFDRGSTSSGSELTLQFAETFRQPVRFVDVYLGQGSGSWQYATTLPGFEGTTRATLPSPGCGSTVRLVAHLADGTVVDNLGQEQRGFRTCRQTQEPACSNIHILASRRADPPLCANEEVTYDVSVTASTRTAGGWRKLEAMLVSPSGRPVSPLALSLSQDSAATVVGTATVATGLLPEGELRIRVDAEDASGNVYQKLSEGPLLVDRTPVQFVINAPAPGARLCAVTKERADGSRESHFEIRGFLADDWLRSATLWLRREGQAAPLERDIFQLRAPERVLRQGVLATFGASQLPPGDYELSAQAHDVYGSVCLAPRIFHVSEGIRLTSLEVAPTAFSPDGDTLLDETRVDYVLDGAAMVSITTVDPDGRTWVLHEARKVAGAHGFTWDGSAPGVPRLPEGAYELRVKALDDCGFEDERTGRVVLDTTPPVARIDAPAAGTTVGVNFQILGEASDATFARYELSIAQGRAPAPGDFERISGGTSPVQGLLGSRSTAGLEPGEYTLRLLVEDRAGLRSEARRVVRIVSGEVMDGFIVTPGLVSAGGSGAGQGPVATLSLLQAAEVELRLVDGQGVDVRPLYGPQALGTGTTEVGLSLAALAGLPDGEYGVQLVARAVVGSVEERVLAPLALDSTPPELLVSAPRAGGFLPGHGDVTGSIGDAHLESWRISWLGSAGEVELAAGNSPVSGRLARLEGLPEGPQQLLLRAVDAAGNTRSIAVDFTSDTTPPGIAFISPTADDFLSGSPETVQVSALLSGEDVSEVKLELRRGSAPATLLHRGAPSAETVSVPWWVAGEPDGAVTLTWTAFDKAGNQASASIPVVVDTIKPMAHLSAPRDTWLKAPGKFLGTARDLHLERYTLEIALGAPSSASSFHVVATGGVSVSGGELTKLSVLPSDGTYTARLTVYDRAGHTAEDLTTFRVDTLPPPVPALTATVKPQRRVALSWSIEGTPVSDIAGYRLLRGMGTGPLAPLGSQLRTETSLEDVVAADGTWRYAVIAVDLAGNESARSNEVRVEVDTSPPLALIRKPAPGARVGGLVDVEGSAFSAEDFREYRLSLGTGAEPASFTQLLSAPTSVSLGLLGTIDLSTKPEGSVQTLLLEAEDLDGNVARARVSVTVDNVAPARPVLVSATPSGADVALVWQGLSETDLAGYLLFRNGVLVNAPADASPVNLAPYLLPPTSTSFLDLRVPDGDLTYELRAMDLAGNLSERSNALRLHLDRYAPVAELLSPASMARLSEPVSLVAQVRDLDVARVQFEVRAGNATEFAPLGPAVEHYPYTASLDPQAFGSAALEVRAVATDRSGRTDPAPVSSFYFRGAQPLAPVPEFQVMGQDIRVGWTDPNTSGAVVGYQVSRWGALAPGVERVRPVAGAVQASSTGSGSAAAAYDEDGDTAWVSLGAAPQRWELELAAPVLLERISASGTHSAKADVWVRVRGLWVPVARDVAPSANVLLSPSLEVEAVAYSFTHSPEGKVGLREVQLQTVPLVSGPPVEERMYSSGPVPYTVSAVTPFGSSSATTASASVYTPVVEALPRVVATPSVLVRGAGAPPGSVVEVIRDGERVAMGDADAQGAFSVEAPLNLGENTLLVRARYPVDSVSVDSSSQEVRYQEPPRVRLELAGSVSGADASFSFEVVEGDTSGVVAFVVKRASEAGVETVMELSPSERSFTEAGLRNGLYRYQVLARDGQGFTSAPSNTVEFSVDVRPPSTPEGLAVYAPEEGGRLEVAWHPVEGASGYVLERASTAEGPFLAVGAPFLASAYTDTQVVNGDTWYYRVLAVDAFGNASEPSAVVSGTPRERVAPDAPWLILPTRPGTPRVVTTSSADVFGMAEPGSRVELFANGRFVGSTTADAFMIIPMALASTYQAWGGYELSADGGTAAYRFTQDSGGEAIAVERLEAQEVLGVLRVPPGLTVEGLPRLSPDRTRVAIVGQHFDGSRKVLVGDVSSGSWREVQLARPYVLGGLAWSPDSARLAYVTFHGDFWAQALAVISVETLEEEILWATADGASLQTPLWMGGDRLMAIHSFQGASTLQQWVLGASTPDVLFTAMYIEPASLRISPIGTRLALVAHHASAEYSGTELHVLDLARGGNWRLARGAWLSFPTFSPDESRMAYLSSGQLVLSELSGQAVSHIGHVPYGRLSWTLGGFIVQLDFGPVLRLDWGGPFGFTGVRLERGTNRLVAFATDASGNRSPGSEPIEVLLDSARLPDLSVSAAVQPSIPLAGQPANAAVTVKNQGGSAASDVEVSVSVLARDGSLRSVRTVTLEGTLAPGSSVTALVPLDLSGLSGGQELIAVADPRHAIEDSERGNNQVVVPFMISAEGGVAAAIRLSSQELEAHETATATVLVANPGPARTLTVELMLEDAAGERVLGLGEELFDPLDAGASSSFTRTFGAEGLLAGDYAVVVRVKEAGAVVATTHATLEILPALDATLALSASRARYAPGEPIELSARVENRSTNAFLSGATVSLEVEGPDGAIVHAQGFDLPVLSMGTSVVQAASLTPGQQAGTWRATARLLLGGTQLATSETSFVVEGRPRLHGAIAVEGVAGEPPAIAVGGILPLRLAVANSGTAPAESVRVRLRVIDPVTLAVVSTEVLAVGTLEPGDSWSEARSLPSGGLEPRTYAMSLAAEWAGAPEAVLSTARFQVTDGTVPLITAINLADGMFVQGSVWAELLVLDDHSGVMEVRGIVDGAMELPLARVEGSPLSGRWAARIPLGAEGPHVLTFSAADQARNDGRLSPREGNPISLTVVSDTVRPVITLSGVRDGAVYAEAVSPRVRVSDEHLAHTTVTLDGRPFLSGTSVEAEGRYVLQVEALDKAGNRSTLAAVFGVDRTAPTIAVSGVVNGELRAGPVEPVVVVTDAHIAEQHVLLDGLPWQPGTLISQEGRHTLEIEAVDRAGNRATHSLSFTIDTTPPLITITGVSDGGSYDDVVTPVVSISDPHLRTSSVLLDGVPYVSGTPVESEGPHRLVVEAEDAAGNRARVELSFTVQRQKHEVGKRVPSGFIRALALLRAGTCELPVDEVERLSAWLEGELKRAGGILQVATDEREFQSALRSGLFDTVLLVGNGPPPAGCEDEGAALVELEALRQSNVRAVTERLFSGSVGLLAIRPRPADWPQLREALGLDTAGLSKAGTVVGWSEPLGPVDDLELSDRAVRLKLLGATPAAWYGAPQGKEAAVATHLLGEGRSVSFGFDPSRATPSTAASEAFQRALAWARPGTGQLAPLGIAAVEISVENLSGPVELRVREWLDPGLTAVFSEPVGVLEPSGRTLEWWLSLGREERALLRYLARLPDVVGRYETWTEVAVVRPAGPWRSGGHTLAFEVRQTGSGLLAEARSAAAVLPVSGHDGAVRTRIEQVLTRVEARPVVTAADAEANVAELLAAVEEARKLRTLNPDGMRLSLDRLMHYWEARWHTLQ